MLQQDFVAPFPSAGVDVIACVCVFLRRNALDEVCGAFGARLGEG